MNATQWQQQEILKPAVQLIPSSNVSNSSKANKSLNDSGGGNEKKAAGTLVRPPKEQPLPCPRCNSNNTKFCYYNNCSLTQPRYFCKGCRRYWTEGGSLRNIPVGGCSRKNKRSPTSSSANLPGLGTKKPYVLPPLQNPNSMIYPYERGSQSLNLTFPIHQQDYKSISDFVYMPNTSSETITTVTATSHQSALELLTGMTSSGLGLGFGGAGFTNSFMHTTDQDSVYASTRFSNLMQDIKSPTLDFSLDYGLGARQSNSGVGMSYKNDQTISTSCGGRDLMSPFGNLKSQQADQLQYEQQGSQDRGRHGVSSGFWSTEMLGDHGDRSADW